MKEMSSKDRISRMFEHKEADRIPIADIPWAGTLARWRNEGMPSETDWRDYFKVDKIETIKVDITPDYEETVIERTDRYTITTSPWGVTMKNFNVPDSTPEFLDFKITNPLIWEEAKARMTVDRSRIPWDQLKSDYAKWQAQGSWIQAGFWFGFDVAHSWMTGTETFLIAMMEEPEWVKDVFQTYLDRCISHFEMVWDAGYRFDSVFWLDDMGYKNTPFFSNQMYRNLLKPYHKQAVDWAHEKGIKAHLHSCGDIMPLVPDILDTGVDALNPIEIKAGMDVVGLKNSIGDRLVLHGGINAVLWDQKDLILSDIEKLIPVLKKNGGYIFSSDHSIPNSVSLENFSQIIEAVKHFGKY